MECKALNAVVYKNGMDAVLIETLWNVKTTLSSPSYRLYSVLIETLWNVKKTLPARAVANERSINRNIVECKEEQRRRNRRNACVLIETLWNVKIRENRTGRKLLKY